MAITTMTAAAARNTIKQTCCTITTLTGWSGSRARGLSASSLRAGCGFHAFERDEPLCIMPAGVSWGQYGDTTKRGKEGPAGPSACQEKDTEACRQLLQRWYLDVGHRTATERSDRRRLTG